MSGRSSCGTGVNVPRGRAESIGSAGCEIHEQRLRRGLPAASPATVRLLLRSLALLAHDALLIAIPVGLKRFIDLALRQDLALSSPLACGFTHEVLGLPSARTARVPDSIPQHGAVAQDRCAASCTRHHTSRRFRAFRALRYVSPRLEDARLKARRDARRTRSAVRPYPAYGACGH